MFQSPTSSSPAAELFGSSREDDSKPSGVAENIHRRPSFDFNQSEPIASKKIMTMPDHLFGEDSSNFEDFFSNRNSMERSEGESKRDLSHSETENSMRTNEEGGIEGFEVSSQRNDFRDFQVYEFDQSASDPSWHSNLAPLNFNRKCSISPGKELSSFEMSPKMEHIQTFEKTANNFSEISSSTKHENVHENGSIFEKSIDYNFISEGEIKLKHADQKSMHSINEEKDLNFNTNSIEYDTKYDLKRETNAVFSHSPPPFFDLRNEYKNEEKKEEIHSNIDAIPLSLFNGKNSSSKDSTQNNEVFGSKYPNFISRPTMFQNNQNKRNFETNHSKNEGDFISNSEPLEKNLSILSSDFKIAEKNSEKIQAISPNSHFHESVVNSSYAPKSDIASDNLEISNGNDLKNMKKANKIDTAIDFFSVKPLSDQIPPSFNANENESAQNYFKPISKESEVELISPEPDEKNISTIPSTLFGQTDRISRAKENCKDSLQIQSQQNSTKFANENRNTNLTEDSSYQRYNHPMTISSCSTATSSENGEFIGHCPSQPVVPMRPNIFMNEPTDIYYTDDGRGTQSTEDEMLNRFGKDQGCIYTGFEDERAAEHTTNNFVQASCGIQFSNEAHSSNFSSEKGKEQSKNLTHETKKDSINESKEEFTIYRKGKFLPKERKPHVFAMFGFGGNIVVSRPMKSSIRVRNVREFIQENLFIDDADTFPGPACVSDRNTLLGFVERKSSENGPESNRLLWSMVKVALRHKGKLSSFKGASDPYSPGSDIVRILKESHNRDSQSGRKKYDTIESPTKRGESFETVNYNALSQDDFMQLFESSWKRGKFSKAVEMALNRRMWELALMVSVQSGDPTLYKKAAMGFCNEKYKVGSSLYTLAANSASSFQGFNIPLQRRDSLSPSECWKLVLAGILTNSSGNDAKARLLEVGDRLRKDKNDWAAAHVAYLAAGWGIQKPHRGARLVLPGLDHTSPYHRSLRTPASTTALHMLEVLEVAQGETGESLVQGHKLRLAMVFADLGFLDKAIKYLDSVRDKVSMPAPGSSKSGPYTEKFVAVLEEFEKRLYICCNKPMRQFGQRAKKPTRSINSSPLKSHHNSRSITTSPMNNRAASTLINPFPDKNQSAERFDNFVSTKTAQVKNILTVDQEDISEKIEPATGSNKDLFVPLNPSISENELNGQMHNASKSKNVNEKDALNESVLSMRHGEKEKSKDSNGMTEKIVEKDLMRVQNMSSSHSSPSLCTLDNGPPQLTNDDLQPEKEMDNARPSSSRISRPSNNAERSSKDNFRKNSYSSSPNIRRKDPPSKGGGNLFQRFFTKITAPEAKFIHEGEAMAAYYDKDKKRWVFPGEDPAPEPEPLAPPPTNIPTDQNSTDSGSFDPLAALMAPPDPLACLMAPPSYPLVGGERNHVPKGPPKSTPHYAVFAPPPQISKENES